MKKEFPYLLSADIIRVIAIFGVVAIHTANSVYDRPDFFGGDSWWFAIVINSLARICIPLFVMLSGYLILRKETKFEDMFKKVTTRLGIPLVFWAAINTIFGYRQPIQSIFSTSFLLSFFSGSVSYLYFLIILIGLYLISPLFTSYIKHNSPRSQKYLAFFFLVIGIGKVGVDYLVRSCVTVTSFTMWVPYTGFFLIGYLIADRKLKIKKPFLILFYLFGFVSTLASNYFYHLDSQITGPLFPIGCITHYSDYYLSINVVVMSVSAFALLIKNDFSFIKSKFIQKAIFSIARASFGIYLVHLFIVETLNKLPMWNVNTTPFPLWQYLILKWFLVFVPSYIFTISIAKLPIAKRLIGE